MVISDSVKQHPLSTTKSQMLNLRKRVLNFLQSKEPKLCVLATTSTKGEPECAVMGYAVLDDLSIVLCTDKSSRKVTNLRKNPKVALTFGWTFEELNIQYEGLAQLAEVGERLKTCEEIYFNAHPESIEFKGIPETIYIKVKPTWYRLSDYNIDPPLIEEEIVK